MKYVILSLFLNLIVIVYGQSDEWLSVGDDCIMGKTQEEGICQTFSACLNYMKANKVRLTICGYAKNQPLVCCPQNIEVYETTTILQLPSTPPRISVQKCNEYRKLSIDVTLTRSLFPDSPAIRNEFPKCKLSKGIIVGGTKSNAGEFPHMAAIGWRNEDDSNIKFSCGGSLISENFVLTAAHCSHNDNDKQPEVVRLGEQNLVRDDDGAQPMDYDILEFIKHANYTIRNKYNDIALIKLAKNVVFNDFIRPACLWHSSDFKSKKVIATGFGATGFAGDTSDELLRVDLNIFDTSECKNAYVNDSKLPDGVVDSQICVGSEEDGKDTCQGDSGGPIQVPLKDNRCAFHIVGVTSFGKVCGAASTPAIYTSVYSYLDWIESVVWNQTNIK